MPDEARGRLSNVAKAPERMTMGARIDNLPFKMTAIRLLGLMRGTLS